MIFIHIIGWAVAAYMFVDVMFGIGPKNNSFLRRVNHLVANNPVVFWAVFAIVIICILC